MNNPVRLAAPNDIAVAAETLAAAFLDYPWTRYVIPEAGYASRLHALQELYLGHALKHGIVAVTHDLSGVAALLPSEAPEPEPLVIEQILALHGDRFDRLSAEKSGEQDSSSWSLETLGVHPGSQGQGFGGLLIQFVLDEARLRGAQAMYLETSDDRNVHLYDLFGFKVIHQTEPSDGPPVWAMRAKLLQ